MVTNHLHMTPTQRRAETQERVAERAADAAQGFVLKALKAPATAKFVGVPSVQPFTDGSYEVTGEVDAQNSFGALLRNHYTVKLRPEDGEWHAETVQVEPR